MDDQQPVTLGEVLDELAFARAGESSAPTLTSRLASNLATHYLRSSEHEP